MRAFISLFIFLVLLTACSEEKLPNNVSRGFDKEKLDKMNASSMFDYNRSVDTSTNPILSFLGKLFQGIAWLLNNFIGYAILAILLALLVWLIIRNSPNFFHQRFSDPKASLIVVQKDHISEMDYGRLLKLALEQQDYRLAIRYSFLNSLKQLQHAKLIDWHREKTNYQYLSELPHPYRTSFGRMVAVYEWVWYGQFEADMELYHKMSNLSNGFTHQIKES